MADLEQVRVYTALKINADDKVADLQSRFRGGDFGGMSVEKWLLSSH